MKLFDLFEDDNYQPLAPGEKRPRLNITVQSLQKIQNKVDELRMSLQTSAGLKGTFVQDTGLQAALDQLEKRIQLKLQYLEKMKTRPNSGAQKMFDILDRECSDFLQAFKETEKFLFRGLRETVSVFEGRSRLDRKPKDSRSAISQRFDQALKNAGFQALRSNSIFTTSNRWDAEGYGNTLYLIFPKNGFDFLHTTSRDLILDTAERILDLNLMNQFIDQLHQWLQNNVADYINTAIGLNAKYHNHVYVLDNLKDAFEHEGNPLKIPEEFNKTMEDFVTDQGILDSYQPNQTDITQAMRDGREILIHGEYWALKKDDWIDVIGHHYIPPYPGSGLTPSWQWG